MLYWYRKYHFSFFLLDDPSFLLEKREGTWVISGSNEGFKATLNIICSDKLLFIPSVLFSSRQLLLTSICVVVCVHDPHTCWSSSLLILIPVDSRWFDSHPCFRSHISQLQFQIVYEFVLQGVYLGLMRSKLETDESLWMNGLQKGTY